MTARALASGLIAPYNERHFAAAFASAPAVLAATSLSKTR